MKKIYLATPFFTGEECYNIKVAANILRSCGNEVYIPMEHFIADKEKMSNAEWGGRVFDEACKAIDECDEVHALCYGRKDDARTAWEISYAYAKGKMVIPHFLDDDITYSLMVVNGSSLLPCDKTKVKQK